MNKLKQRTVLFFTLRMDAIISFEETKELLENSLGCVFLEGELHGASIWKAELLGMQVIFLAWRGLNGAKTFQLIGTVEEPGYVEKDGDSIVDTIKLNISQAVIDLLEIRGAGKWRIPSLAELKAEVEYANEIEQDYNDPEDN